MHPLVSDEVLLELSKNCFKVETEVILLILLGVHLLIFITLPPLPPGDLSWLSFSFLVSHAASFIAMAVQRAPVRSIPVIFLLFTVCSKEL